MFFHSIPGTALMFLRAAFHAFFGLRWYHLWHYNFDMLYRFSCFYFLLDFFSCNRSQKYICMRKNENLGKWLYLFWFVTLRCIFHFLRALVMFLAECIFFLIFILPSVITFWLLDKKLHGFKLDKWFIFMFCYSLQMLKNRQCSFNKFPLCWFSWGFFFPFLILSKVWRAHKGINIICNF